ncbi:hypothetical protein [Plantactinospora endophytica]|uniref:Uncharacterized protein n=1 Tax=Plantactinospora endophytica TaxID=673535 RepID=A0ABQ4E438_9ACTN|nr:hypothetical protein [Plantactinospora endophytica]GIG89466.1 hypothetical protein Pen02_44020 [Plantactinospora endophytica]
MNAPEAARPAEPLVRQLDLLVRQVGHWTPPRWAAPGPAGGPVRADLVHRLVQQLADLAADAAGEPRRRVPRLENALALPDQLRVMVADLVDADPPASVLAGAAAEMATVRQSL